MNKNKYLYLFYIFISLFAECTTIAPGLIYNSTTQHVYKDRSASQLGSGRILKRAESCYYNSILTAFIYHGIFTSVETLMKEEGIVRLGVIDYSSSSFIGPLLYKNCIIIWGDIE